MKLKKYAVIGIMALLVIVGCDNKGNDKNNKDKVKVTNVKRDISTEEIAKYNEYLKLSDVPNSEEWNTFFTEIKKEEFTDGAGNVKNISEAASFIQNLDNSVNLAGEYIKEITDVMQKVPKMEAIDKNAENLVNSLIEEQKVLTEINDYFEKGDYKTDKLSKIGELNDKYKVVLQNRQENHKIFTNSLHEIAQIINQKIEKQLQIDGKTAKLNILKFVNSVDNFGKIAFGKNNLNFDENEIKMLEEANKDVQNTYKEVSEMTLENAKKENINEEDFKKIKESSKLLSENMQKMVAGVKNQKIQDVVMSASNILSSKTDLENVFNVLMVQK
nr:DUF3829 domain-containing protein [uncultured Leptotrichia sp.]